MTFQSANKRLRHGLLPAAIAFLLAAALAAMLVWQQEKHRLQQERAHIANVAGDQAHAIANRIDHALTATYALAAMVRQGNGDIADFDAIAREMLPFYRGAASLQLAPAGVVRRIAPLAGNEKAIGHDLLKDPARTREAFVARDTGMLTLAGPFDLVQGGLGAVGRFPVFLDDGHGRSSFWGFTIVLLRFPDVIDAANLPQLVERGMAYELWRIHPDTGNKQVIAASAQQPLIDPVEQALNVPNATWKLSVAPAAGWGDAAGLWLKAGLGLLFSLVLANMVKLLVELKAHKRGLEALVAKRTAELQAREADLNRAQSVARIGSWRIDLATNELRWSAETYRIFGVGEGSPIDYDTFLDHVHPDDRKAIDRAWIDALQGAGYDMQHRIMVGGTVRWVREQVQLEFDPGGNLRGGIGTVQDITESKATEQALIDSESRYRTLFTDSRVIMLVIDPADGRIVDANAAACAYYGHAAAALKAMTMLDINTLSPEQVRAEMSAARDRKKAHFDFRHRLASGEIRDVEVDSGPIDLGGRRLLLSVVQDVTDRKHAEARMREAMVVFNASSQGIMTTDANGVITSVSPAFCTITGYSAEDAIGQKPSLFKSGRHDAAFYEALWGALASTGVWEGEIWNRRKSGESYPEWLTISAVRDDSGKVIEYVALFSDITHRKQQEEAIWRQANFDALTGLANRNLLHDRLERALAQARRSKKRVGLLFLDLDGFKWINDALGHDVGDRLLVEVAGRLLGCVRDQDTVARLGGDEFTIVAHDVSDGEDLRNIGEKVLDVLREPFTLANTQHHLSASIGISIFPDDAEDVQTLLRNADIAMYKSKQTGKNRFHFYARQMQVDAQARIQLEADLRFAIEQQAFVLHYQPIVAADSGELVGAEALIRWQHPERGMIMPLDFIPAAEDCGLIGAIGEWALREAARQWRCWRESGLPPLRIAVNVSGIQFGTDDLPGLVGRVLAEYGVDHGSLILEITESVLMDGSTAAQARMREIKALGVGYALDDFGTGFSSLSYLKRFPVDIVKIDRSFINDCPDDQNDAHLVEAIINMAHSLDLRVTAEGVETEAQLTFLRRLGCDYLQGYLISKPMAAAEFATLIERRLLPPPGRRTDA